MIDHLSQYKTLEELKITDKLVVTTSLAFDERKVFLKIDYMQGNFTIQKHFDNNYMGLEELEKTKIEFNTEDAVKQYFGL